VSPAGRRRPGACFLAILSGIGLVLLSVAPGSTQGDASPRWGWLGVRIRDLSEQEMEEISRRHGIREGFGAVIVEVLKETPAEVSGLQAGDLVVAFLERPVVDTRSLQRYVASSGVGETVALTVLRRDEGRRRVSVRLGLMPDAVVAERVAAEFGFLVREPEAQPELGGARPSASLAVTAVFPGSRAQAAGLRVGDILVEVNGRPVLTFGAVREALAAVSLEGPLALRVRRDAEQVPLVIRGPRSP